MLFTVGGLTLNALGARKLLRKLGLEMLWDTLGEPIFDQKAGEKIRKRAWAKRNEILNQLKQRVPLATLEDRLKTYTDKDGDVHTAFQYWIHEALFYIWKAQGGGGTAADAMRDPHFPREVTEAEQRFGTGLKDQPNLPEPGALFDWLVENELEILGLKDTVLPAPAPPTPPTPAPETPAAPSAAPSAETPAESGSGE
jgi:hypothetical protein